MLNVSFNVNGVEEGLSLDRSRYLLVIDRNQALILVMFGKMN